VQLIEYYYDADETWMVWPPDLSVNTFISMAPFIVDQMIQNSFYLVINGYIKEARDEVYANLQDFQTALTNLRDSLQLYNTTINGNVSRYNFTKFSTFI
jgi:hypothetical protein